MVIDGINFKELNITKDGELIASITDGKDGIVHKDGYRVQLVVEDVGMSFAEAFKRRDTKMVEYTISNILSNKWRIAE